MTKPVALNYDTHQNLRVITSRGAKYGENTHIIPVIANELSSLVLEYPVFFTKSNETGQFELTAMLGFESGENLFLQEESWHASYVPMHVLRQPFFVLHNSSEGKAGQGLISIDMNSPRLHESEGEALFNTDGSQTTFLKNINTLLSQLLAGTESTKRFTQTLVELNLLETTALKVNFKGEEKRYEGLYSINDETLKSLSAETLEQLNKKHYLEACFLQIASMGNIKKLINQKNENIKKGL